MISRRPNDPNFYPRSPCGERPRTYLLVERTTWISIHALLAESDGDDSGLQPSTNPFLSTLSLRRATSTLPIGRTPNRYFYPRSPCGERHAQAGVTANPFIISIHALLAESDERIGFAKKYLDISIHALLAESDPTRGQPRSCGLYFYPRSPCGERRGMTPCSAKRLHFYPRSPCGERLG